MTVFRSEQRRFLAWCMERDKFTADEAHQVFGGQKTEMYKRLRMLESKGHICRTVGAIDLFTLADRNATRRDVAEKPLPRNGYVRVADRPQPKTYRPVNSVFQLGAQ